MVIFADNCQGCGNEFLSTELTPIKIGGAFLSRIKICKECLDSCDIDSCLIEASQIMEKHADKISKIKRR